METFHEKGWGKKWYMSYRDGLWWSTMIPLCKTVKHLVCLVKECLTRAALS